MMEKGVSVTDALSALSDGKSLTLFDTIALTSEDSSILISKIRLSRKQYYSRMAGLIKAGLIKRKNGKYFLTAFGKIVYYAKTIIECGLSNYWKLKAIDSIETYATVGLPAEEHSKIIDNLIDHHEIKSILLRHRITQQENTTVHRNDLTVSTQSRYEQFNTSKN